MHGHQIGKSGVGRTHRPVKGCQIERLVQRKRLGTRINVGHDILGMNGHQLVSVQTVGQIAPDDKIGIDHDTGGAKVLQGIELASRPETSRVDFPGNIFQYGMNAVIPQKSKAKGGVIVLGRVVA